uniref:T-cell receptor alpha/delta variable 31.0 n=1 Tax=Astyanax mexicanus TaxID=7994 RepID=A0A3B1JM29_ASTMX
ISWCSVFTDCSGEERVEQPVRDVTRSEGTSVTLECTYQTSSSQPNLFWYIQRSHDFPKYILRRDKYSAGDNGTEFHERMSSAVQSTSVPLSIQKLSVRDSAVYYCALRPTVTSSHSPIIQKHAAQTRNTPNTHMLFYNDRQYIHYSTSFTNNQKDLFLLINIYLLLLYYFVC